MYTKVIIGSKAYFERISASLEGSFLHINSKEKLEEVQQTKICLVEDNYADVVEHLPENSICLLGSSFAENNSNIIRYNDWPGCIEQEGLEVTNNISEEGKSAIGDLGKKPILVPNVDGFISQRIISLIINEAYFTEADGVSTEEDIDTAMMLGTNYPYGPIEWSKLIGIEKIYALLNKMTESNKKYSPCDALKAIGRK